jgi:solute carrier family 41
MVCNFSSILSLGGLILDKAVEAYKGIAAFQPVINGVGGNLAGVQSSRLSTYLHRQGQLGKLPPEEGERVCISPWRLYFGKSISSFVTICINSYRKSL